MRSSTVLVFAAGANASQLAPSDRTDNSKVPGEVNDSSLVQESWGDAYHGWSDVHVPLYGGSSAIGLGLYLGVWFGVVPVAAAVVWPVTVVLAGAGLLAKMIDSLLWFRSDSENRKKLKSAEQNLVKEWKKQSGYEGDNPTSADLNKSFSHMLEVKEVNFQFLEDTSWMRGMRGWWKRSEYIGQLMSIHFRQMQVGDKVTVAEDWTSIVNFWRTTGPDPNTKINTGLEFTVVHVPTSAMDESSRTIEKPDWDKWKDAFKQDKEWAHGYRVPSQQPEREQQKKAESKLVLREFIEDQPRLVLETDVIVGFDTMKAGTVISKINGESIRDIVERSVTDVTNPKEAVEIILDAIGDSFEKIEITFAEKVLGLKKLHGNVVLYIDVTDSDYQEWVQKKIVSSEQYNFNQLSQAEQRKFLSKNAQSKGLSKGAKMQKSSTRLSTNFSQQKTNIFTATSDMKEISPVFKEGGFFQLQRDVQASRLSEGDKVKFRQPYADAASGTKGTITNITQEKCVVALDNLFGVGKKKFDMSLDEVAEHVSPLKARHGDIVEWTFHGNAVEGLVSVKRSHSTFSSDDVSILWRHPDGRLLTWKYEEKNHAVVMRKEQLVSEISQVTIPYKADLGMVLAPCTSQRLKKKLRLEYVVLKSIFNRMDHAREDLKNSLSKDAVFQKNMDIFIKGDKIISVRNVTNEEVSDITRESDIPSTGQYYLIVRRPIQTAHVDDIDVDETKAYIKKQFRKSANEQIEYAESNPPRRILGGDGSAWAWNDVGELVDAIYDGSVPALTSGSSLPSQPPEVVFLWGDEDENNSLCVVGAKSGGHAATNGLILPDHLSLKIYSAKYGDTILNTKDHDNFQEQIRKWQASDGELKLEVAAYCASCPSLSKGTEVKVGKFDSGDNLKVQPVLNGKSAGASMYISASQVDEVLFTPKQIKEFEEKYKLQGIIEAKNAKATDVALTNFSTAVPVGPGAENTTIFRMFKSRLAYKNDYEAPFFKIKLQAVREQQIAQAEQVEVTASANLDGLKIDDNWTVTQAPGSGNLMDKLKKNVKIVKVGDKDVNDIDLTPTRDETDVPVSPQQYIVDLRPIELKYIDEDKEFTVPIAGDQVMKPDGTQYEKTKGKDAVGSMTVSLKSLDVKAAADQKETKRKRVENVQGANEKHRQKIAKTENLNAMKRKERAKDRKRKRAKSEYNHKRKLMKTAKKFKQDEADWHMQMHDLQLRHKAEDLEAANNELERNDTIDRLQRQYSGIAALQEQNGQLSKKQNEKLKNLSKQMAKIARQGPWPQQFHYNTQPHGAQPAAFYGPQQEYMQPSGRGGQPFQQQLYLPPPQYYQQPHPQPQRLQHFGQPFPPQHINYHQQQQQQQNYSFGRWAHNNPIKTTIIAPHAIHAAAGVSKVGMNAAAAVFPW